MLSKINNFNPRKMIIGSMIAGSVLAGGLSSCGRAENINKEKIEYVQPAKDELIISKSAKDKPNRAGFITTKLDISEKDSPLKNAGKRIGAALLGGAIGGLIGIFRKDSAFLNKVSHCAVLGGTAGLLTPGLTMSAIIIGASTLVGGIAGTFFSGGNDKIGKITAAAFGILTGAACLL